MSIDIKKLRTDESLWPEGAERVLVHPNGFYFLKRVSLPGGDSVRFLSPVSDLWEGFPTDTAARSAWEEAIPRPKPQQAKWDGQGLPPEGAVVEYAERDRKGDVDGELWGEGDRIEILAHRRVSDSSMVAICWNQTLRDSGQRAAVYQGKPVFRPIQAPEQKERKALEEDLLGMLPFVEYDEKQVKELAQILYAQGYRKPL